MLPHFLTWFLVAFRLFLIVLWCFLLSLVVEILETWTIKKSLKEKSNCVAIYDIDTMSYYVILFCEYLVGNEGESRHGKNSEKGLTNLQINAGTSELTAASSTYITGSSYLLVLQSQTHESMAFFVFSDNSLVFFVTNSPLLLGGSEEKNLRDPASQPLAWKAQTEIVNSQIVIIPSRIRSGQLKNSTEHKSTIVHQHLNNMSTGRSLSLPETSIQSFCTDATRADHKLKAL